MKHPPVPVTAYRQDNGSSHLAILRQDSVRNAAGPAGDAPALFQSACDAGADAAGQDRAALAREPRPR